MTDLELYVCDSFELWDDGSVYMKLHRDGHPEGKVAVVGRPDAVLQVGSRYRLEISRVDE